MRLIITKKEHDFAFISLKIKYPSQDQGLKRLFHLPEVEDEERATSFKTRVLKYSSPFGV